MCKICTYCRRRQDLQYQILQSRCDNFSGIPREFYPRNAIQAIHRHTAAELIMERADAKKTHMGLTTWRKAPDGKIEKSDVSIAKNYLSKDELYQLERFVTMYLDYAEFQAKWQIPMTMEDWALRLNKFLDFNEVEILTDKGRVSAESENFVPREPALN